jgi:short-subunit dehydrogenase
MDKNSINVGITGYNTKLGKSISKQFLNIIKLENDIDNIDKCDVFINNFYDGELQKNLFKKVFDLWINENKTIVNIISSSALFKDNHLGSYSTNKKKLKGLIDSTIEENPNKKIRIINIYPWTLSSNKQFDYYNKVDIERVSETIKYAVNLPHEIELRDISIFSTTRDAIFTKNKLF